MKLTAKDMANFNIVDQIIDEPAGGAHTDWQTTMELLASAVANQIEDLQKLPAEEMAQHRAEKFIAMTRDVEIYQPEHKTEEH